MQHESPGSNRAVRGWAAVASIVVVVGFVLVLSSLGKLQGKLDTIPGPTLPERLSVISVSNKSGEVTELEVDRNTVLLVSSNKCDHCVRQLKEFRALYDSGICSQYDVSFLVISLQAGRVPHFEDQVQDGCVRILHDEKSQFFLDTFGGRGLPFVCYVLADGRIPYVRSGLRTPDFEERKIDEVFGR